jgi:hypothetical protein
MERKPDIDTEITTIARQLGHPALSLPGIEIEAGSAAWARWMWMSHTTKEQRLAVHAHLTGNTVQNDPVPSGTNEWTEEDSLRTTAGAWEEIVKKDPGCWVPDDIIAYWRKQGRIYKPTKEREEPTERPEPTKPAQQPKTRKVANFASQEIVEISA